MCLYVYVFGVKSFFHILEIYLLKNGRVTSSAAIDNMSYTHFYNRTIDHESRLLYF